MKSVISCLLLLCLLLSESGWAFVVRPVGDPQDECNIHCPPEEALPFYEVGKVYSYRYESNVVTMMEGASSQRSGLAMGFTVEFRPLSSCKFVLSVKGADSAEMMTAASAHDLKFSYIDGKVSHLCTSNEEPEWVLNIKRGILSSFQHLDQESVNELDVMGDCLTQYRPAGSSWENKKSYTKHKESQNCKNNHRLYQYALNLPDFPTQKLPLISSNAECNIRIGETGILENNECYVRHKFQPFQSREGGAVTDETTQLKFLESKDSKPNELLSGEFRRRTNLLFHHQDYSETETVFLEQNARSMLKEISGLEEYKKPERFSQFVHLLRQIEYSKLVHIFYEIENVHERDIMMDAVPLLKTESGVTLMRDIIQSNQLPDEKLNKWFFSFTSYKNPTIGMISTISSLLSKEPPNAALIGVSTMVQTFCESQRQCFEMPSIQSVIKKFENLIQDKCMASDEDSVIMALRGISNMGFLTGPRSILRDCYFEKTNSMFVRVAALKVYQALSCVPEDLDHLKLTFSNIDEDSEIRIEAYMAVMKCPSPDAISYIKEVLVSEPVNQVGSFIWTHLTNIQESQSEDKEALQRLIGDEFLENKWKTDVRKFSRYFEMTKAFENSRTTLDGTLVFSQDSYVPRSTMMNISANVFGQDIDLLRFDGRVEGLEPFIEDLFSPKGYFKEDSIHKLLRGLRNKRDSPSFNNYLEGDPQGRYFLKIFGRDNYYGSFNSLSALSNQISQLSPLASKDKIFNGESIDYSHSSIFLDGKIIVPMASGLPLSLSVNGSTTFSLKSQMDIQLDDYWSRGKAHLKAQILPTASIQVNGIMSVDGHFDQTGMKSSSHMHVTSHLDGFLDIDTKHGVKAALNVPKENVRFIDVDVDFYLLKDKAYVPLVSENPKSEFIRCTPRMFNDVFGIKLCGESSYHYVEGSRWSDMGIYFAGPSNFSIGYQKTDVFDKYVLDYEIRMDESTKKITLAFDTPGSTRLDRLSNMTLLIDDSKKFYSMDLAVPYKSTRIVAKYRGANDKILIDGQLHYNKQTLLWLKQSLDKTDNEDYDFSTKVTYMNQKLIDAFGRASIKHHKMGLDATLESSFHEPISVSGNYKSLNGLQTCKMDIKSKPLSTKITASSSATDSGIKMDSSISYRLFDQPEHLISLIGTYKSSKMGVLQKHDVSFSANPTQFPDYASELSWSMQLSENYAENQVKIRVGETSTTLEQLFSSRSNEELEEFIFKLMTTSSPSNKRYGLTLIHHVSQTKIQNQFEVSMGQYLRFNIFYNWAVSFKPLHYLWDAGFEFSNLYKYGVGIALLEEEGSGNINGEAHIQWKPNERYETSLFFLRQQRSQIDYIVTANIDIPGREKLGVNGTILISPQDSTLRLSFDDFDAKHYNAELNLHRSSNEDMSLDAQFLFHETNYQAKAKYLKINGDLNIQLKVPTIGQLLIETANQMREMDGVVSWEEKDTEDWRLNTKVKDNSLSGSLSFQGHKGIIFAMLEEKGLEAQAKWNDAEHYFKIKYNLDPRDFVVKMDVKSPWKRLSHVTTTLKYKLEEQGIKSQIVGRWNKKEFTLNGIVNLQDNDRVLKIRSTSSEPLIDGLKVDLIQKYTATRVQLSLGVLYKSFESNLDLKHQRDTIASDGEFTLLCTLMPDKLNGRYVVLYDPLKALTKLQLSLLQNDEEIFQISSETYPRGLELSSGSSALGKIGVNASYSEDSLQFSSSAGKMGSMSLDAHFSSIKGLLSARLNAHISALNQDVSTSNSLYKDEQQIRLEMSSSFDAEREPHVFNFRADENDIVWNVESPKLSFRKILLSLLSEGDSRTHYSLALNDATASYIRQQPSPGSLEYIVLTPVGEGKANFYEDGLFTSLFNFALLESSNMTGRMDLKSQQGKIEFLINKNLNIESEFVWSSEKFDLKVVGERIDEGNKIFELASVLKKLSEDEYKNSMKLTIPELELSPLEGVINVHIGSRNVNGVFTYPKEGDLVQKYSLDGDCSNFKDCSLSLSSNDKSLGSIQGELKDNAIRLELDLQPLGVRRHTALFKSNMKGQTKSFTVALSNPDDNYLKLDANLDISSDRVYVNADVETLMSKPMNLIAELKREPDVLLFGDIKLQTIADEYEVFYTNIIAQKNQLTALVRAKDKQRRLDIEMMSGYRKWSSILKNKESVIFEAKGELSKDLKEVSLTLKMGEDQNLWDVKGSLDSNKSINVSIQYGDEPMLKLLSDWEILPERKEASLLLKSNFQIFPTRSSIAFNMPDINNYKLNAEFNGQKLDFSYQINNLDLNIKSTFGRISSLRVKTNDANEIEADAEVSGIGTYSARFITRPNKFDIEFRLPQEEIYRFQFDHSGSNLGASLYGFKNHISLNASYNFKEMTSGFLNIESDLPYFGLGFHELKSSYDIQNMYDLNLEVNGNKPLFAFRGKIEESNIRFSSFFLDFYSLELNSITLKFLQLDMFLENKNTGGSLAWDLRKAFKGDATLDWKRRGQNVKNILSYDMSGEDDNQNLLRYRVTAQEDSYLDTKIKFTLGDDSFKGQALIESSFPGWNSVEMKGSYEITAYPTARLSINRKGEVEDELDIKVKFDDLLPTVFLTTSFSGYEKIILKDSIQKTNGLNVYKIKGLKNRENWFNWDVIFKEQDGYNLNAFAFTSNLDIEYLDSPLKLDVHWDMRTRINVYSMSSVLSQNNDNISLSVNVDIEKKSFEIIMETPFQNYEKMSLIGKTGTTSIGKSMGISFGQNRSKREISLDSSLDENGVESYNLKTPFKDLSEMSLRVKRGSEGPFQFGFESKGQLLFGFGAKYDLRDPLKSLDLAGHLTLPFVSQKENDLKFHLKINLAEKGSLEINTPIRKFLVEHEYNVLGNGSKKHDTTLSYKDDKYTVELSRNELYYKNKDEIYSREEFVYRTNLFSKKVEEKESITEYKVTFFDKKAFRFQYSSESGPDDSKFTVDFDFKSLIFWKGDVYLKLDSSEDTFGVTLELKDNKIHGVGKLDDRAFLEVEGEFDEEHMTCYLMSKELDTKTKVTWKKGGSLKNEIIVDSVTDGVKYGLQGSFDTHPFKKMDMTVKYKDEVVEEFHLTHEFSETGDSKTNKFNAEFIKNSFQFSGHVSHNRQDEISFSLVGKQAQEFLSVKALLSLANIDMSAHFDESGYGGNDSFEYNLNVKLNSKEALFEASSSKDNKKRFNVFGKANYAIKQDSAQLSAQAGLDGQESELRGEINWNTSAPKLFLKVSFENQKLVELSASSKGFFDFMEIKVFLMGESVDISMTKSDSGNKFTMFDANMDILGIYSIKNSLKYSKDFKSINNKLTIDSDNIVISIKYTETELSILLSSSFLPKDFKIHFNKKASSIDIEYPGQLEFHGQVKSKGDVHFLEYKFLQQFTALMKSTNGKLKLDSYKDFKLDLVFDSHHIKYSHQLSDLSSKNFKFVAHIATTFDLAKKVEIGLLSGEGTFTMKIKRNDREYSLKYANEDFKKFILNVGTPLVNFEKLDIKFARKEGNINAKILFGNLVDVSLTGQLQRNAGLLECKGRLLGQGIDLKISLKDSKSLEFDGHVKDGNGNEVMKVKGTGAVSDNAGNFKIEFGDSNSLSASWKYGNEKIHVSYSSSGNWLGERFGEIDIKKEGPTGFVSDLKNEMGSLHIKLKSLSQGFEANMKVTTAAQKNIFNGSVNSHISNGAIKLKGHVISPLFDHWGKEIAFQLESLSLKASHVDISIEAKVFNQNHSLKFSFKHPNSREVNGKFGLASPLLPTPEVDIPFSFKISDHELHAKVWDNQQVHLSMASGILSVVADFDLRHLGLEKYALRFEANPPKSMSIELDLNPFIQLQGNYSISNAEELNMEFHVKSANIPHTVISMSMDLVKKGELVLSVSNEDGPIVGFSSMKNGNVRGFISNQDYGTYSMDLEGGMMAFTDSSGDVHSVSVSNDDDYSLFVSSPFLSSRSKRSLGGSYNVDEDNNLKVSLSTPFEGLETMQAEYMSDGPVQKKFSFESKGNQVDFGFGASFDLTNPESMIQVYLLFGDYRQGQSLFSFDLDVNPHKVALSSSYGDVYKVDILGEHDLGRDLRVLKVSARNKATQVIDMHAQLEFPGEASLAYEGKYAFDFPGFKKQLSNQLKLDLNGKYSIDLVHKEKAEDIINIHSLFEPKANGGGHLKLDWFIKEFKPDKIIEGDVTFATKEGNFLMKVFGKESKGKYTLSEKALSVHFGIPGRQAMDLKLEWDHAGDWARHEYQFSIKSDFQVDFLVDADVRKHLKASLLVKSPTKTLLSQKIDANLVRESNNNKIDIILEGNMNLNLKFSSKHTNGEWAAEGKCTAKGIFSGSFSTKMNANIFEFNTQFADQKADISLKRDNEKYSGILDLDILDKTFKPIHLQGEFKHQRGSDKYGLSMDSKIMGQNLEFRSDVRIKTTESDVFLQGKRNGIEEFVFKGKRSGFSNMEYDLQAKGKKVSHFKLEGKKGVFKGKLEVPNSPYLNFKELNMLLQLSDDFKTPNFHGKLELLVSLDNTEYFKVRLERTGSETTFFASSILFNNNDILIKIEANSKINIQIGTMVKLVAKASYKKNTLFIEAKSENKLWKQKEHNAKIQIDLENKSLKAFIGGGEEFVKAKGDLKLTNEKKSLSFAMESSMNNLKAVAIQGELLQGSSTKASIKGSINKSKLSFAAEHIQNKKLIMSLDTPYIGYKHSEFEILFNDKGAEMHTRIGEDEHEIKIGSHFSFKLPRIAFDLDVYTHAEKAIHVEMEIENGATEKFFHFEGGAVGKEVKIRVEFEDEEHLEVEMHLPMEGFENLEMSMKLLSKTEKNKEFEGKFTTGDKQYIVTTKMLKLQPKMAKLDIKLKSVGGNDFVDLTIDVKHQGLSRELDLDYSLASSLLKPAKGKIHYKITDQYVEGHLELSNPSVKLNYKLGIDSDKVFVAEAKAMGAQTYFDVSFAFKFEGNLQLISKVVIPSLFKGFELDFVIVDTRKRTQATFALDYEGVRNELGFTFETPKNGAFDLKSILIINNDKIMNFTANSKAHHVRPMYPPPSYLPSSNEWPRSKIYISVHSFLKVPKAISSNSPDGEFNFVFDENLGAELSASSNALGDFTSFIFYDNKVARGKLAFEHYPSSYKKSLSFHADLKPKGKLEFTFFNNKDAVNIVLQNESGKLKLNRGKRETAFSWDNQDLRTGMASFTTNSGVHKLIYSLSPDYTGELTMESPHLPLESITFFSREDGNGISSFGVHSKDQDLIKLSKQNLRDFALALDSPALNYRGSYMVGNDRNMKASVETPFYYLKNVEFSHMADEASGGKFSFSSEVDNVIIGLGVAYDIQAPFDNLGINIYAKNIKDNIDFVFDSVYHDNKIKLDTRLGDVFSSNINAMFFPQKGLVSLKGVMHHKGTTILDTDIEASYVSGHFHYNGKVNYDFRGSSNQFTEKIDIKFADSYSFIYEAVQNDVEEFNIQIGLDSKKTLSLDCLARPFYTDGKLLEGKVTLNSKTGDIQLKVLGQDAKGAYVMKDKEARVQVVLPNEKKYVVNTAWEIKNNEDPSALYSLKVDLESNELNGLFHIEARPWNSLSFKVKAGEYINQSLDVKFVKTEENHLTVSVDGDIKAELDFEYNPAEGVIHMEGKYDSEWRLILEFVFLENSKISFDFLLHSPILTTQHLRLLLNSNDEKKGLNLVIDILDGSTLPLIDFNGQVIVRESPENSPIYYTDFDFHFNKSRYSLDANFQIDLNKSEFFFKASKNDESIFVFKGKREGFKSLKYEITIREKPVFDLKHESLPSSNQEAMAMKTTFDLPPQFSSFQHLELNSKLTLQGDKEYEGSLKVNGKNFGTGSVKLTAWDHFQIRLSSPSKENTFNLEIQRSESTTSILISRKPFINSRIKIKNNANLLAVEGKFESSQLSGGEHTLKIALNKDQKTLKVLIEGAKGNMKMKGAIKSLSLNDIDMDFALESSITPLKKLVLHGKSSRDEEGTWKTDMKLIVNEIEYAIDSDIKNMKQFLFHVRTPFVGFESNEFELVLEDPSKAELHTRIGTGENEIKVGSHINFNLPDVAFDFEVHTHMERAIHVEFEVEMTDDEKTLHLEAGAVGKEMKLKMELEDEEHVEVEIHLPIQGFENVEVDLKLLPSDGNEKKFEGEFLAGKEKYVLSSSLLLDENTKLTLELKSPNEEVFADLHLHLQKVEFGYSFETKLESSFSETVQTELHYEIRDRYFEGELKTSSAQGPMELALKIGQKEAKKSYTFESKALMKELLFDVSGSFLMEDAFGASVKVNIPALGESHSFALRVKPQIQDFELHFSFGEGGESNEASLKYTLKDKSALSGQLSIIIAHSLNVQLPFGGKLDNGILSGHIHDNKFELKYDPNGGAAFSVLFELMSTPSTIVYYGGSESIKVNMKYDPVDGINFYLHTSKDGTLSIDASLVDRLLKGSFSIKAKEINFNRQLRWQMNLRPKGTFEIFVTEPSLEGRRRKRDLFGIELQRSNKEWLSSGILVLMTGSGIHKVSYSLSPSSSGVISLESPYLQHGHVTVSINYNDELSGQLSYGPLSISMSAHKKTQGLESSWNFHSKYANSNYQFSTTSLSIKAKESKRDLSVNVALESAGETHEIWLKTPKNLDLQRQLNFQFKSGTLGNYIFSVNLSSFLTVRLNDYHIDTKWSLKTLVGSGSLSLGGINIKSELSRGYKPDWVAFRVQTNFENFPELALKVFNITDRDFNFEAVSPFRNYEFIHGNHSLRSESAHLVINSAAGIYDVEFNYSNGSMSVNLNGPDFQTARAVISYEGIQTNQIHIQATLKSRVVQLKDAELDFTISINDIVQNGIKGLIRYGDDLIHIKSSYDLRRFLIDTEITTTFVRSRRFELKTGFDFDDTKMLKLYGNYWGYKLGFQFEYFMHSYKNFSLLYDIQTADLIENYSPLKKFSLYVKDFVPLSALDAGFGVAFSEEMRLESEVDFEREASSLDLKATAELGLHNVLELFVSNEGLSRMNSKLYTKTKDHRAIVIIGGEYKDKTELIEFTFTENRDRSIHFKYAPKFNSVSFELGQGYFVDSYMELSLTPSLDGFDGEFSLDNDRMFGGKLNIRSKSLRFQWSAKDRQIVFFSYKLNGPFDSHLAISTSKENLIRVESSFKEHLNIYSIGLQLPWGQMKHSLTLDDHKFGVALSWEDKSGESRYSEFGEVSLSVSNVSGSRKINIITKGNELWNEFEAFITLTRFHQNMGISLKKKYNPAHNLHLEINCRMDDVGHFSIRAQNGHVKKSFKSEISILKKDSMSMLKLNVLADESQYELLSTTHFFIDGHHSTDFILTHFDDELVGLQMEVVPYHLLTLHRLQIAKNPPLNATIGLRDDTEIVFEVGDFLKSGSFLGEDGKSLSVSGDLTQESFKDHLLPSLEPLDWEVSVFARDFGSSLKSRWIGFFEETLDQALMAFKPRGLQGLYLRIKDSCQSIPNTKLREFTQRQLNYIESLW